MFAHGGSNNHGCEAIVRSTVNILGSDNRYFLQSFAPEEDRKFGLDKCAKIITSKQDNIRADSLTGYYLRAKSHFNSQFDFDVQQSFYRHKGMLVKSSCALSIGGDNYCYGLTITGFMRDQLTALNAKNIPVVLWGCSINPESLTKPVIGDLEKYSLITARESLTAELLNNSGFSDKTVLCSDPAFTLPKQETGRSDIFSNNRVIGINISNLMGNYETYKNATYNNFRVLIDYILKNTDYHIALIPHVRKEGNDDLVSCLQLANDFKNERITVISEDFNCMQLKDIISKCSLFIGCRTHSTIAAYSTCVPTLVVGYSVKAQGIAKDIFGDYKDLLVDVRKFESDTDLLNAFLSFHERKDELKTHLHEFMPEYINRAYLAKTELERRL